MAIDASQHNDAPLRGQQPQAVDKRIIKRVGGRHLVFRINHGPWWFLPKPYALISNIEGSILVFYGIGQIWVTHRKLRRINEWMVRVPRFISRRITTIVDELENDISEFINKTHDHNIIGTIIVERRVIEFHWTVPRKKTDSSPPDLNRAKVINDGFNKLARAFAKLQLAGQEGTHDVEDEQIQLHPPE